MLSKLSSLQLHEEETNNSEHIESLSDELKYEKSSSDKLKKLNNNYQSVIELDKSEFENKWRTAYSDEI